MAVVASQAVCVQWSTLHFVSSTGNAAIDMRQPAYRSCQTPGGLDTASVSHSIRHSAAITRSPDRLSRPVIRLRPLPLDSLFACHLPALGFSGRHRHYQRLRATEHASVGGPFQERERVMPGDTWWHWSRVLMKDMFLLAVMWLCILSEAFLLSLPGEWCKFSKPSRNEVRPWRASRPGKHVSQL